MRLIAVKGFNKHTQSTDHTSAMALWVDRDRRDDANITVRDTVLKPSSDQTQWLLTVFHVIRYLSANGQPLRGENEADINTGDGLFLRTFSQLLFPLNPHLIEIHKRLPENAKYTSHDIQDEVIEILASLTKQSIANEIKKAKLFTIMADGTTDKNRKEVQGLVCRYWIPGENIIKEHCLNIEGVDDRSAKGIFAFIKNTLEEFDISMDGLVSQSYDGASVMSGDRNGLKILISEECKRFILYVHCFLHKISLVVRHALEGISDIQEYFDIISTLYNLFKKSAVMEIYEGTQLKRLIETRWSGHFDSTSHMNKNYGQVLKALNLACKSKKLRSEERAIAIGLINQMVSEDDSFPFINCMLMEILTPINIVVKSLQSAQENLTSALQIINSLRDDLNSKRSLLNEESILEMISDFKEKNQIPDTCKDKRSSSIPGRFQDFIITDQIPGPSNNSRDSSDHVRKFKECIDVIENEFKRRFSDDDVNLWCSMECLSPKSDRFLDADSLNPLFEYAKTIPVIHKEYMRLDLSEQDLKCECRIFKRVLEKKDFSQNGLIEFINVAEYVIKNYLESAPVLCTLYQVAITAGYSQTRVECLFSSLAMVDTPQRRSMLTKRECLLAYLSFESKTLFKIDFETFLSAWKTKNRKLTDI